MSLLLCIETSSSVCSVSLVNDGRILAIRETAGAMRHAEQTAVFIEEVFHEARLSMAEMDGVALSGGPGSYTGLRIGASTAKGICWALDKPLIAVPTLLSMASGASRMISQGDSFVLCPLLDARRMEVYTASYDASLREISATESVIVDEKSFSTVLEKSIVFFFGDGMPKCKEVLGKHPNSRFLEEFVQSSSHLYFPARIAFESGQQEHVGLYEPFYFKEFVAGKGSVLPGS